MKMLRFVLMALAVGMLGVGLSSCVLTVENTAGNLESIMGEAKNVSTLRISGPLNGDDIFYLREILTSESCKVSTLDLSDASIVDGGMAYYIYEGYDGNYKYYTSKDKIGDYMFSGCRCGCRFRTVILPNTVTSIGDYAFSECNYLEDVVIGNNVGSIGSYAFRFCMGLKKINIPNSVTSIGEYAFFYCTSLTNVVIGNNVTSIGDFAFYFCENLRKIIIPNSVTSIGLAFYDCVNLTNVVIGNNVTSIEDSAFYFCENLKKIIIPNSVTSIGDNAFVDCKSLSTLIIGDRVKTIGDEAFDRCDKLYEVYCYNPIPPNISSKTFTKPIPVLYVPKGSLETYETEWGDIFTNISEME